MRHISLTCKNHPELRWSCKSIATSANGGYNGSRHIFFLGSADDKFAAECPCHPRDLILAPGETWDKECED